MADVVQAQHLVCRFPRCRRKAARCDLDHRIDHPYGQTCPCNLEPLCRSHHNLKTHGHWLVRPLDPTRPWGDLIWTSPHGNEYLDHPEPALVDAPDTEAGVGAAAVGSWDGHLNEPKDWLAGDAVINCSERMDTSRWAESNNEGGPGDWGGPIDWADLSDLALAMNPPATTRSSDRGFSCEDEPPPF